MALHTLSLSRPSTDIELYLSSQLAFRLYISSKEINLLALHMSLHLPK